jgi:polysaccharide export outer membrane protein
MHASRLASVWTAAALAGLCALPMGCAHDHEFAAVPPPDGSVPRELAKVTLPPYVIEPPDILLVRVLRPPLNVEKNPYSTTLPPQPIDGQHLVRPDGTISLGIYGSVQVSGLTYDQARERVRKFVAEQAQLREDAIQVEVDVIAYNSKNYYVITDGAGYGEQAYKFAITGSETVLDAISNINGLPAVASKRHIWVARRIPNAGCAEQILPVDWCAIVKHGDASTNYQVLPGDRIYVEAEAIFSIDAALAKFLSPIERIFGVTLLGSETVNSIRTNGSTSGSGNP